MSCTSQNKQIEDQSNLRELLEAAYKNNSTIHVNSGNSIPLLPDKIWLVIRGMVKLGSVTFNGDELLLGLAGPGQPFGEPMSGMEVYEAICTTDCDLICINLKDIENSHALSSAMASAMYHRYRQSQRLLSLLGLRKVQERIQGFLEMLIQEYGIACNEGIRLDLRLTHQEIASALSTTRVTVTRVLGHLRSEGWLKFDSSRHLILTKSYKAR